MHILLASLAVLQPGFRVMADELPGPPVAPSRVIELDTHYGGEWVVAGDLDGDGQAEIIAARNDEQVVTSAIAYRLDGTVLWRWGQPDGGRSGFAYDVPLVIYDLDGDGTPEVFLSVPGFLVVLDGATGRELRRHPLPEGLAVSDCVVFADLSGKGRATDILVKTRYTRVWAFAADWRELWSWAAPEGYLTCHHPTPVDLDGDGRDEVLVGYTMLRSDGALMWTFATEATDLRIGHLDAADVVCVGGGTGEARMRDSRLLITCCGSNLVALLDGAGHALWEVSGHHFESPDFGTLTRDHAAPQFTVDIDHVGFGQSETWLMDAEGKHLGTYVTGYGRHHRLIDWNGDGLDELLITNARGVFDGEGRCVARLTSPGDPRLDAFARERVAAAGDPGPFGFAGDMDGDGQPEVVLHTDTAVYVFRSETAAPTGTVGTGTNWTLY